MNYDIVFDIALASLKGFMMLFIVLVLQKKRLKKTLSQVTFSIFYTNNQCILYSFF